MIKAIIVDDEQMVREGLKEHYHWSKYDIQVVDIFENGECAFKFIQKNNVDLIISDIVMPGMNGFELVEKAREINPNVKIIFVSGYTDAKYLLEALKLNATDFIFKSIDFAELDEAIERVVKSRQRENRLEMLEKQVGQNIAILVKQQIEEKTTSRIIGAIIDGNKSLITETVQTAFETSSTMSSDDRNNFLFHILLLPTQILQNTKSEERGPYRSVESLLGNFMQCKTNTEKSDFILSALVKASEIYSVSGKKESNAVISAVINEINGHFKEQISVSSLAENVKLSPAYLCVLFKQVTGLTINQYITQTRLQKAKEMLKDVKYSIEEICYETGYLSTSYFSRLFKQTTGLAPSEYRNSFCESKTI